MINTYKYNDKPYDSQQLNTKSKRLYFLKDQLFFEIVRQ